MLRAHYANALAAALCFMTSASRSTPSGLPLAAKPTVAGGYLVVNDDFSAVNNGVTKGNTLSTLTPYFSGNVHGIYQVLPIGDLVGEFAYGDWTNVTTGPSGGDGNVFAADGATISQPEDLSPASHRRPERQFGVDGRRME